ncbi:MAG: hypothetical protein NC204_00765 [Candidatus Amulumruptor caecigallinarius]|nr:hypothetical protein [Candidatus Amulumruptor caecigallinarius]
MKKTLFPIAALCLLAACSGNKQTLPADSSADSVSNEAGADLVMPAQPFYLTADSIGPVRVGAKIVSLPKQVPDLYDTVLPVETPDAMAYTFLLGDEPQFTIFDFMNGNVDVIALEGNARSVSTPEGDIHVGDEFAKVLRLPGVESDWQNFDESGIWYWKWNGLFFGVDETAISTELSAALAEGRRPPRAFLFTPDVKIGYIATGLPF